MAFSSSSRSSARALPRADHAAGQARLVGFVEADQHVVEHRHALERERLLEGPGDAGPGDAERRVIGDVLAVEDHLCRS